MKRILVTACCMALSIASPAVGRATSPAGSVTRFHLGSPVPRGEIRVEAADPREAGGLAFVQQAEAVERELQRLGWNVNRTNGRSEQVAIVGISQAVRSAPRRTGFSVGLGAGTGGYRSGVGAGVGATLPIGRGGARRVVATTLRVRIQRRSDANVLWEGRGVIEARGNDPLASPAAAVGRLAPALFQDFPGESGRTIRLR